MGELITTTVVLYQPNILLADNLGRKANNSSSTYAHLRAHQARTCALAHPGPHLAKRRFLPR